MQRGRVAQWRAPSEQGPLLCRSVGCVAAGRKWTAAAHLLQPANALGKPLGFSEVAGGNVLHLLQAQYLNLPIIVVVPKHGEIPLGVHFRFRLATFLDGVIDR